MSPEEIVKMYVMPYRYSKERLQSGESYPLKRSQLDALLQGVAADLVTDRRSAAALGQGPDVGPKLATIKAHYVGIEDRWPYKEHQPGNVVITVGSVKSVERSSACDLLRAAAERLVAWLGDIPKRPATWRSEPHQLDLYFARGEVGESEDGHIRYRIAVAG
jgi:hypothetical protein